MIIDGIKKAQQLTAQLKKSTDMLLKKGVVPGFGILLVGDDPASHLYVAMKVRLAKELGFYCVNVTLSRDAIEEDVVRQLEALQRNPRIHGVIIQIPLPGHLSLDAICAHLDKEKDIDCLHPDNLKALSLKTQPRYLPPTAESVLYLIHATKTSLLRKKVVVVGRGFFAQQIAALCAMKGARVLAKTLLYKADIIVSVVGKPGSITGDSIKKGAIVIDVGTTKVGSKTIGDVDLTTVEPKARAVSPVPGGVGPVTVVMLMKNVLIAAKRLTSKS